MWSIMLVSMWVKENTSGDVSGNSPYTQYEVTMWSPVR